MEENKKYYIHDIETGWPVEVDKETYDKIQAVRKAMWDAVQPKDKPRVGMIFITGTGGNIDDVQGLEKLFYDPKEYKAMREFYEDKANRVLQGCFLPASPIRSDENGSTNRFT